MIHVIYNALGTEMGVIGAVASMPGAVASMSILRVVLARSAVGSIGCSSSQLHLVPCAPSSYDAEPAIPPSSRVETTGRVPP